MSSFNSSITISKNVSLFPYNTMKADVLSDSLSVITKPEQLTVLLSNQKFGRVLVLGSGSNILFTKDFNGLIIKNEIKGIEILSEDDVNVIIKTGAGVTWHDFVQYTVDNNWSGIENLALIPGTVGAAPVQNIGAYGQEIKDVLVSVDAVDLNSFSKITFLKNECRFTYRNSIFKNELKNKIIITHITVKLKKVFTPNLTYPALADFLKEREINNPTLKQVFNSVIAIRQSKLPDYYTLSNCGSFFTNPFLDESHFNSFIKKHPVVPSFPFGNGVKLSAGWLIEQCGWKGKRIGNVGCYEKHALVLVNYGGASGKEIYEFAMNIRESVYKKFEVLIEPEVNIL